MSRVAGLTTSAPGAGAVAPTVVVTVAPVADQLTLATISPTVSATTNGAAATITAWAWTVSGPATIANETTATPTITPTAGGVHVVTCAVTVDGIVYYAEAESFTVGDADGWVTVYAPNLAALASADWRSGGPGFTVEGKTWTVRNQSTFSTGVLGPDGSTGIRFKPSTVGADWWNADSSAGGISLALADVIPGLDADTQIDVICAFRYDNDVDANFDVVSMAITDGPHTSGPRGAKLDRVYDTQKHRNVMRRLATTQVSSGLTAQADPLRGKALRVRGMTITPYWNTSEITTLPDSSFTGWTSQAPWAVDAGNPGTATQWTVASLTASILAFLAGTAPAGLDVTLTGLWVRARL